MYQKLNKTLFILFFSSFPILAEIAIQEGIYDAAEEMIRFDEKMNKLIAEHNQIDFEDEEKVIEDFEETNDGYLLVQNIDGNHTKVVVKLLDRVLTISTINSYKETIKVETESSYEMITQSSSMSLFLPEDADANSMQKSYINQILEIKFLKTK